MRTMPARPNAQRMRNGPAVSQPRALFPASGRTRNCERGQDEFIADSRAEERSEHETSNRGAVDFFAARYLRWRLDTAWNAGGAWRVDSSGATIGSLTAASNLARVRHRHRDQHLSRAKESWREFPSSGLFRPSNAAGRASCPLASAP